MKMTKVDDLDGDKLDAWVFRALGYVIERYGDAKDRMLPTWFYSDKDFYARMQPPHHFCFCIKEYTPRYWAHMSQLIEACNINFFLERTDEGYLAVVEDGGGVGTDCCSGSVALERAIVRSKFGDEVNEDELFSRRAEKWRGVRPFQREPV